MVSENKIYKVTNSSSVMRWALVFCVLFSIGIVSAAASSSSRSDFSIAGCPLNGISIPAGECSLDGRYYCGETSFILYDTLFDDTGCSFEQSVIGQRTCCPFGYVCEDAGTIICNLRNIDCSSYVSEATCIADDCYWIVEDGVCVNDPTEYSCSLYRTSGSCEEDVWNLGKRGEGTSNCETHFAENGVFYSITDCHCSWETSECNLAWITSSTIHDGNPDSFKCSKSFGMGSCVEGSQNVNWSTSYFDGTGSFSAGVPFDVLVAAGCVNGTSVRGCGEPLIKLPGFSLFSLFVSIFILVLFYLWKGDV